MVSGVILTVCKTRCDYGEVIEALYIIFQVPLFPIEVGEEVRIGREDSTGCDQLGIGANLLEESLE